MNYHRFFSFIAQPLAYLWNRQIIPPPTHEVAIAGFTASAIAALVSALSYHLLSANLFHLRELLESIGSVVPGSYQEIPDYGYLGPYAGIVVVYLATFIGGWIWFASPDTPIKPSWVFAITLVCYTLASLLTLQPLFPWISLL